MGQSPLVEDASFWNRCRFDPRDVGGHYESYFLRANHPQRQLAFWIRYTIFAPRHHYDDALGELWAIWFDGEHNRALAAKGEYPLSDSRFGADRLDVRVGGATLSAADLEGRLSGAAELRWSLRYCGDEPPLLLLPRALYERSFPKAKAVVSRPGALFNGTFSVGAEVVAIEDWIGTQNHNWGSRHTDEYAWGQVARFDNTDAMLECSTARVRLGPLWTPWMTLVVLRLDGEEIRLNTIWQAMRARRQLDFFDWHFDSRAKGLRVRGRIQAPVSSFVALPYYNPPGGTKTCLNSKLASCTLTVDRAGGAQRVLRSRSCAAFEILTDRTDHGVAFVI
jgi:hypothetical protein